MSTQSILVSMPSLDDTFTDDTFTGDTFTTSRAVVQQKNIMTDAISAAFTVEVINGGEEILLHSFDGKGGHAITPLSYETANALQVALSDALDDLETFMD